MVINDKIKSSISHYMGIIDDGILVMLCVELDGSFYDGTFWYNIDGLCVLTFSDELVDILGVELDLSDGILISSIFELCKPYDEIYKKLEKLNDE